MKKKPAWRLPMLFVLAVSAVTSLPANAAEFSLNVLWSTPIKGEPPPPPVGTVYYREYGPGLVLSEGVFAEDGSVTFLANDVKPKSIVQGLLRDVEKGGQGEFAPLSLKGVAPSTEPPGLLSRLLGMHGPFINHIPYVSYLAVAQDGTVWAGGATNTYMDIASSSHSSAYLARLNRQGKPIWEKVLGKSDDVEQVNGMTLLRSGDLIVLVTSRRTKWLSRITPDGTVLWKSSIESGGFPVITSLPDGRIMVAEVHKGGDLSARVYDEKGELRTQTPHMQTHEKDKAQLGGIRITTSSEAVYVASSWTDLFQAKPVELSKLAFDGSLLWSKEVPDTIKAKQAQVPTWYGCTPALAAMPDGEALLACAIDQRLQLYQFDRRSGSYKESYIALPECQSGHPASLDLLPGRNGAMVLSGSRPMGNVAENCSWVGKLVRH